MICLDNTDVIEGGASVDAVIDYQMHGLVGTTFTQLAAGVMGTTLTTVLYTAGAAVSVVSVILVNKHTSAVNVTLCLDPANGGNPRYLLPKTISLGAGYSLHTDGTRFGVYDASGTLMRSYAAHAADHTDGTDDIQNATDAQKGLATAAQITKLDGIETGAKAGDVTAAANITDNAIVVGDGGAKGVKELTTALSLAKGGSGTTGDSVVKAWIQFNGTGTIAIQDSFNVISITDNGVGTYTVTWDTDFANDDYACVGTTNHYHVALDTYAVGSITMYTSDNDHLPTDYTKNSLIAMGDQ